MHRLTPTVAARPARSGLAVTMALAVVATIVGLGVAAPASAARAAGVTPRNLTGYAFDQCLAPSQRAMDAWLTHSPYWAAGIYVSGASRGCPSQPNLTPTWVRTQLRHGWRLLPITLGPQAWCTTRERYLHQVRIDWHPRRSYSAARAQGRAEARKTIAVAQRLGIGRGSTLWYDIEAFDISPTYCRESALSFLSAWTHQMHVSHYVSGVYSSAASGIKMLDDARVNRPGRYRMPDRVWIADWNGRANTTSSYVRSSGWTPHRRVHQYRGGHNETYGGVTINIDRSWVDLGRGSWVAPERRHCQGAAKYDFRRYATRHVGDRGILVRTIQCLLRGKGLYDGRVDGRYDRALGTAVSRFRVGQGISPRTVTGRTTWVALLSQGSSQLVKVGSASATVRRLQRALNAADRAGLTVTGRFDVPTRRAVRAYQRTHRMERTGVVTGSMWGLLHTGHW